MIRITTNYFCAGAIIENGEIVKAAPILQWMVGRKVAYIKAYCDRRKWEWKELWD